jgi:membrane protein YdbS with pleckstrin-like domain
LNVTVCFLGYAGFALIKNDGKPRMKGATKAGEHRSGQIHFRHHGLCWALPVALGLLAPLTYGLSLVPAALRAVQLLRRRSWLGEASVITVRGLFWRRVTQLPLADVEYVQVKEGLLGRFIDCGTVIVHGAGGTRLVLGNLAHPKAAQRALQRALKVLPRRGHVRESADLPNPLPAAA